MRNKYDTTCHYCDTKCEPGTADIWKAGYKWLACCDTCEADRIASGALKDRSKKEEEPVETPVESPQTEMGISVSDAVDALVQSVTPPPAPEQAPTRRKPGRIVE